MPFDALVVFSTNIAPKKLVDEAALRRLRYKILVDKPDRATFIEIFARTAKRFGLVLTEEILAYILTELYAKQEGAEFHAYHPRFLIEQTKAICAFEGVAPQFRPDFLRRAWGNLFLPELGEGIGVPGCQIMRPCRNLGCQTDRGFFGHCF
jgi:hypothetical protein